MVFTLKFEELKRFIQHDMRMEKDMTIRPIVIKTLLQNDGKASKNSIKSELRKANPGQPIKYFDDSVFEVLEEQSIARYDEDKKTYHLADFETFSRDERDALIRFCNQIIKNPVNSKLKETNIKYVVTEFKKWLKSKEAVRHRKTIEGEKQEVQELMHKLSTMDKKSPEFTAEILYALLPYPNVKVAKRTSTFPALMNVKKKFKSRDYTDEDWNKTANMIYDLASKFQNDSSRLDQWIKEFTSDKIHAKGFQSGSISPILFCINDSFPVINNKIRAAYKDFSQKIGWGDKIAQKLEEYMDSVEKCNRLINFLEIDKDLAVFDLFCWWYISLPEVKKLQIVGDHPEEKEEVKPLSLPSKQEIEKIKQMINETLLIDGSAIDRIIASLYAGKHVLLTGPVGTGKTDLARTIPKIVWNYYPEIHTATSDWTTQDVIGGLFPKLDNGEVKFRIQKGCVSSTVSKNWSDKTGLVGVRKPYRYLDPDTKKVGRYNGVWLVIDEFNRANIDRAFGQLFTALEYKNELKVPTEKTEEEAEGEFFERCVIPDDYRIIGTLNTYDRHFLFHLSDALKRRFDFIEINPPSRKNRDREIAMIHKKAADEEILEKELQKLSKSNEKTDEKLYEIMSFIRRSKQLGTALMISIFKDMLIYHKMGQDWDESLDSALVKKIIPQLESLQVSTLGTIKRFVNGNLADFYVKLSHDEHSEKIDDYARDLEAYGKYYYERFDKNFSNDWIAEFRDGNLNKLRKDQPRSQEQVTDYKNLIKDLNPWNGDLKTPKLASFKFSLDNLIKEKEYTSVNSPESDLN